ncbi:MAG: hypothetical protein K6F43_05150 [Prevotella sp.]|nr:hypothetical protein [Prevotella sp.]
MRNRNYQPFAASDVQPYVDFFDEHGTANDRMLAHYLLGRAYHDQGEAPMALECYHDAVDCADTTADDCDYAQLARVYAQMAQVFYRQGLYKEQLEHCKNSVTNAWKGKDTIAALMSYEQESYAYRNLNLVDSSIYVAERVSQLYVYKGLVADAAISLASIIRPIIERGELIKARKYMNEYESKSGYFTNDGTIIGERAIYYNVKGLFYLHIGMLDSVEYYFRKELNEGHDFNNQHAGAIGMAKLYQRLCLSDSVAKYSLYAYAMSDSLTAQKETTEVERMQSMYNYTRHKEIARQEKSKAVRANLNLLVCIVIMLIALLVASWLYIARKKVKDSYTRIVLELNAIRVENNELKQNTLANEQQITQNEKKIKILEKKLGKYGKLVFFGAEKMDNDLKLSPNYQQIQEYAYKGRKLSEDDWERIRILACEYYPEFYDFLLSNLKVNSTEYHISLLLRLHFKTGEIANMLGVTPPYISRICKEILEKLYAKRGSSKDLYQELCKIK